MCAGCATIISGLKDDISINCNPTGAIVTVTDRYGNDVYQGTTPCSIELKTGAGYFRSASYSFQFEKEGYNPDDRLISAQINPWYFVNIILGAVSIPLGLFGMIIIDPLSGSMWKLDDNISISLSESSAISPSADKPEKPRHLLTVNDMISQIQELEKQRDEGSLTEEEFEARRKDIVDKMIRIKKRKSQ